MGFRGLGFGGVGEGYRRVWDWGCNHGFWMWHGFGVVNAGFGVRARRTSEGDYVTSYITSQHVF